MKQFLAALLLSQFVSVLADAHPMGNFSVNHYARIEVGQPRSRVLFVLDLAELPTLELLQEWNLQSTSPRSELERKAIAESKKWMRELAFTANGKSVTPVWQSAELVIADGAGGLPVARISTRLTVAAQPGTLRYVDRTYPGRTAGWKEIVVRNQNDAVLEGDSHARSTERSEALTAYPQDPASAPPNDLDVEISWRGQSGTFSRLVPGVVTTSPPASEPLTAAQAHPPAVIPTTTGPAPAQRDARGQVRRGDFLSTTLRAKEIGWGLGLLCAVVAFWFGALHALEPGHGKTMVAAYLVGERGTTKHAVILGGMVTFTHTVSVFLLGFLTMFLSHYIMPDVITKWLGVISGLTIVWIGGLLFYRRTHALAVAAQAQGREIEHVHDTVETAPLRARTHTHSHGGGRPHTHRRSQPHTHSHGALAHTHDGNTHSHVVEGEISMKSLLALGASGGLVPCPSALVLLLAAVSVGRIGFGILLLLCFSVGLALVLTSTGLLVLYAKRFLPERKDRRPGAFTIILPIVSAAVIVVIGLVLTGNAIGWIPVIRYFG